MCLLVAFTYSPAFGADVRDFGGRAIQFRDSGSAQAIQAPDEPVPAEAHVESTVTTVPGGDNVNTIVGANAFYSIGITGQNSISANVEAGHVWGGHEALSHVTSFSQDGTAFNLANGMTQQENLVDRHATWVGGHIGGRVGGSVPDERQRGIAHDTDLRSGAIANDFVANPIAPFRYTGRFNITGVTFDTPYRNFFGTADVINSSWGGTDPGGSGFYSRLSDALADQNPTTTFVASAGNSGPGPNTVGFPGSAYNGITVGALENNGANVYNSIVFFSSRGPQDFDAPLNSCSSCRAAVDIAAPGTRLKAAYYGGETGGNNTSLPGPAGGPAGDPASFSPPNGTTANGVSGTSFSAPITAGAAALLHSASKTLASFVGNTESRDARVIKAVLMNSAAKVPGWTNAQMNVGGVIQTTQSLDVATAALWISPKHWYSMLTQIPRVLQELGRETKVQ